MNCILEFTQLKVGQKQYENAHVPSLSLFSQFNPISPSMNLKKIHISLYLLHYIVQQYCN